MNKVLQGLTDDLKLKISQHETEKVSILKEMSEMKEEMAQMKNDFKSIIVQNTVDGTD